MKLLQNIFQYQRLKKSHYSATLLYNCYKKLLSRFRPELLPLNHCHCQHLPKNGDKIKLGDKLIDLEAVKWTGNLKSPVSGEVFEINKEADDEPAIINSKPYETWLVKIKISNKIELKNLLSYEEAIKYYKNKE